MNRTSILALVVTVAVACTEFPNEPTKTVTVQPASASWTKEWFVRDSDTLVIEVRLTDSRPVAGLNVHWQSNNPVVLEVTEALPATGSPLLDSLTVQLRAKATAHARGHAQVTVVVEGGGAFKSLQFTDTIVVREKWVTVSAGHQHTCGVTVDGDAFCWGSGFLGNGSAAGSMVPVQVKGGLRFDSIAAGDGHTCGALHDGTVYCWGVNSYGAVGSGASFSSPQGAPVPISSGRTFVDVTAGMGYACGISFDTKGFCWGLNNVGQLGDAGLDTDINPPRPVPPFDNCSLTDSIRCSLTPRVVQSRTFDTLELLHVTAGDAFVCGILVQGGSVCWGDLSRVGGQQSDEVRPVGGGPFETLAAGGYHACGIRASDAMANCWGYDFLGQLGTDSSLATCAAGPCSILPVRVAGQHAFRSLSAGQYTTCGVGVDSIAYCWGSNQFGQLGSASGPSIGLCSISGQTISCAQTPIRVPSTASDPFVFISVGSAHACAVTVAGRAYCWGQGTGGKLGANSTADRSSPTRVCEPEGGCGSMDSTLHAVIPRRWPVP